MMCFFLLFLLAEPALCAKWAAESPMDDESVATSLIDAFGNVEAFSAQPDEGSVDAVSLSIGPNRPIAASLFASLLEHTRDDPEDDISAGSEGESKNWGDECEGRWEHWSDCSNQCVQVRNWKVTKKTGECEHMPPDNVTDARNCNWGDCPLESFPLESISAFHLHKVIKMMKVLAFPCAASMVFIMMVTALVRRLNLENVPDGLVIMATTVIVGCGVRWGFFKGLHFAEWGDEMFNDLVSATLLYLVLPISIFEGAYHCQRLNFWDEMGHGIIFAVFGVLFSAIMLAIMVKYSGDAGMHPVTTWRESFCYAAFIADTDPVATLAVFAKLKADALLTTLVAGEATLNDPVAIVIFSITNSPGEMDFSLPAEVLGCVKLLVGSIVLGIIMGIILTVFFNMSFLHGNDELESMFVIFCAFLCMHTGDLVGMSGIIVALFGGLIMGIFLPPNLKDPDKVDNSLGDLARLMDSITFVLVGIAVMQMDEGFNDGIKLGLLTIVFAIITRCVVCGALIVVINAIKHYRGYDLVPVNTSIMIMHSGLRGAMTVMMAINIDTSWSENKNVLIDATVITVMGLMLIIGTTGPCMLRLTGVPMNVPQDDGTLFHDDTYLGKWLITTHEYMARFLVVKRKSSASQAMGNLATVRIAAARWKAFANEAHKREAEEAE